MACHAAAGYGSAVTGASLPHQGRIYVAHLAGIDKVSGQEVILSKSKRARVCSSQSQKRKRRRLVIRGPHHRVIHDDRWHTVFSGLRPLEP